MRGFFAILNKELSNFFVSPIAYAVIGSFLLLAGIFFTVNLVAFSDYSLKASSAPWAAQLLNIHEIVVRPLVQNMSILLLFVAPALTMRLFAEEKKSGCIELLLTYPISDTGIVLGKFVAACIVVLLLVIGTLPCIIILFGLGSPDLGPIIGSYVGLAFMGMAFVSIGVLISSLTENQIVAFSVTFMLSLAFWAMSWVQPFLSGSKAEFINQVSLLRHMETFEKGIISLSDISFFVLFTMFFLFLTLRSIETYRWKG